MFGSGDGPVTMASSQCVFLRSALRKPLGCLRLTYHGVAISSCPQTLHFGRIHAQSMGVTTVEELSSKQAGQVAVFVDLLLEWNQVSLNPHFCWVWVM